MSTSFKLDLDTNTFEFGNIANGQVDSIKGAINFFSRNMDTGYSGSIEGQFTGEIKNQKTIPMTVPHVTYSETNSFDIIVIGAGGTGGYLIRDLARFIFALKKMGNNFQINLTIVDGDIVEEKNVLRQNFMPKDIGKFKAEVLAKRYANAFGIEIGARTEMITDKNYRQILASSPSNYYRGSTQTIIVGCVDNNKARRLIYNKSLAKKFYWIDSGNETKSGQVVLGYGINNRYSYYPSEPKTQFYIPNVVDLYPEINKEEEDEKEEEKVSCAERSTVDTQNIFVNMSAAGYALNFVRQIVLKESITISSVEFNIKGLTQVQYLTDDFLKKVYNEKRF